MPRAESPHPASRRSSSDERGAPRRLDRRRLRWGLAATGVIALVAGVAWFVQREPRPEPHLLLAEALKRLDRPDDLEAWSEAREAAEYLRKAGQRDPGFPGGAEYVLGVVAFREAQTLDEAARQSGYLRAVHLLREAESRALDAGRRPELAYALGVSLYYVGTAHEARPLLDEAVRTFPPGRAEAAKLLVEVALEEAQPDGLEAALALSTELLDAARRDGVDRDGARLRQAQVLMNLGRSDEAHRLLDEVSPDAAESLGARVLRAQALMARAEFQAARDLLQPVAEHAGLEQTFPRQAALLMGECAERLGDVATAIADYERTARQYPESPEGVAASVAAANLLRGAGRNEETLAAWRRALPSVRRPGEFRNRWLSFEQLRQSVLATWNGWIERGEHAEAIALAEMMHPLFPPAEARELAARAHQHWAEQTDRECEALPEAERKSRESELRRRWRETGRAWSELAEALSTSSRRPEILWQSAECYRNGRNLTEALAQVEAFLAAQPPLGVPLAMVRRGELLMDLDRQDEALESFWRVIAEHPSDPASFEARLLVARCQIERSQPDEAERALRAVLKSRDLDPAAREWRLALFELGRLLCRTAAVAQNRIDAPTDEERTADEITPEVERIAARWEEAVRRLDEFLRRYPDAAEAAEARFLLARALQGSAELPHRRLRSAETENARQELARAMRDRLTQAAQQWENLHETLEARQATGRLDAVGERLLADCAFEIAHTQFALDDFEQAILRYGSACHRYPHDPRVLLAYVQMSQCYQRLDRPAEARSMLEQAKILLRELPDETFAARTTNFSRAQWAEWLDWAATQIGDPPDSGDS